MILIGEIRDTETMEAAITFAETGHLCIGTLHSNNANQAIERIINFFPVERHAQIYLQLSLNLRAIISQRLIPSVDGKRVPALEIMLDTPRIKDLVKKAEIDILKEAMEQGVDEGCQTFDHVLFQLYKANKISLEQALINADSANNLRLKIKLEGLKGDDAVNALLDKQAGASSSDAFKFRVAHRKRHASSQTVASFNQRMTQVPSGNSDTPPSSLTPTRSVSSHTTWASSGRDTQGTTNRPGSSTNSTIYSRTVFASPR